MFKSLLRDRKLLILTFVAIVIKLFGLNESWVESYYTYGVYPYISMLLRLVLGWIPFSVGDLLYIAAFIYLVTKTWKLLRLLVKRKVKEYLSWILFRKYLKLVLWIYILFNVLWGLNYDRQGISQQLALDVQKYSKEDLFKLTRVLQKRLNHYAEREDSVKRLRLRLSENLFAQAVNDYQKAQTSYHYLIYHHPSLKPSVFSGIGHYFGFSGYLNPFTNEAQMNMAEPVYTKPFVVNHEIAHQLGYGKENEASFVSYLVGKDSDNTNFRYSIYYELFFDALSETVQTKDTVFINDMRNTLHLRVKIDKWDEIQFRTKRKNKMAPYVSDFYNSYLKLNNQPKGLATYDEVIAWLVAYMKKYGEEAI